MIWSPDTFRIHNVVITNLLRHSVTWWLIWLLCIPIWLFHPSKEFDTMRVTMYQLQMDESKDAYKHCSCSKQSAICQNYEALFYCFGANNCHPDYHGYLYYPEKNKLQNDVNSSHFWVVGKYLSFYVSLVFYLKYHRNIANQTSSRTITCYQTYSDES